ncbi:cyclopropane fatty acyl phospholipid synthase [Aestuariicella hydrocarbonica]|uniref:Cyclopropane fatty acyl phospholipid synthase n=1 Tax=Pseudomaricurvus hydrocarbonicus TaxID=1470433 RepID=A0A9E5MP03_9GAMM|nr:cyclopropane fatty acyl phospholipid synthase [Aestuariicella hydrocarbonica]NHO67750.1 cyclopropane fatty acyl phospholipid synthase [Aestuariicella hydrocarbonica]
MRDSHFVHDTSFYNPSSSLHRQLQALLLQADIRIDGDRPWDMHFNAEGVLERISAYANLGLGEAYMDRSWDADKLDQFFFRLLRANLQKHSHPMTLLMQGLRNRYLNLQTYKRAWQVGEHHYDIGNDFYRAMLDARMTYTCGYWRNARNLDEAQEAKLDLICQKLHLKPGMRLLDIGCGWGSLMGFAAEHYGVSCVGITISKEQARWAEERYKGLPLEFRLQDYRQLNERFDCIASIGMFEHVGRKNHRTFMEVVHRCLPEQGLFLLHTIGRNHRHGAADPWIDKYIFPNGDLPSVGQIGDAVDNLFVTEDLHNFGADYDKTLMAWHRNFEAAWPDFSRQMGDRFYRMWRYYLLSCAGAFRARNVQLWQWVFSKEGLHGGYTRVAQ